MTLYSANVLDFAKPVTSKKRLAEEETESVKEKKPRSEKQIAAFAKAKETRERKKAEAQAAKEAEAKAASAAADAETAKEAENLAKKEAAKEKRRLKKEGKKATVPLTQEVTPDTSVDGIDQAIDEAVEVLTRPAPPPVKKRESKPFVKVVNDDEPPSWFKQYVAGVKKEESKISREKKPQKVIRMEAEKTAKEQWGDGFTRDRVQNEVDGHMSRMYNMMFSGRRLR